MPDVERRKIAAARLYIETLRNMHPDPVVLESLVRQEEELNRIEANLPPIGRHRRRNERHLQDA